MSYVGEMGPGNARLKVSGRGLRHRKIGLSQRAAIVAQAHLGEVEYLPTVRERARGQGLPESYVAEALTWSPDKRAAVAAGRNPASIAKAISTRRRLAPPSASAPETLGDQLSRALRIVGGEAA